MILWILNNWVISMQCQAVAKVLCDFSSSLYVITSLLCIKDTSYAIGKKQQNLQLVDILACNSANKCVTDFKKMAYQQSYQSGIQLGWVPMCATWLSAVHENKKFGTLWLSVTCPSAWIHLAKCIERALIQVTSRTGYGPECLEVADLAIFCLLHS